MTEHDARDGELRNLLRGAVPAPPVDDVDWSTLHARITARTRQLPRVPAAWWQPLATWSSRGIPAAAAAAVVAALMLGIVLRPDPTTSAAFVVIEEELAADLAGSLPLLVADADEDVLDALLFYEED